MHSKPGTSSTSISWLSPVLGTRTDGEAWRDFVARYGPKIYQWCRCRGLGAPEAEDVTQDVLLKLFQKAGTFRYDPSKSFRAWLKTVTFHAVVDYFREKKDLLPGGSGFLGSLEAVEDPRRLEDLFQALEDEYKKDLVRVAEGLAEDRVEKKTWEAYGLLKEGLSGIEVAERLGMTVEQAYNAKSRVLRIIRKEMERLDPADHRENEV